MAYHGRKLFDPGKDGVGRYVSRRGAAFGICPSCGARRLVTRLAWNRASRPQCACGAYLEPSRQSQADRNLAVRDKNAVASHGSCVICHGTLSRYNEQATCGSVRCRRAYDAIREHFLSRSDGFTDIEWTESLEDHPSGFKFKGCVRFWTRTLRKVDAVVSAPPLPQASAIRPKDTPTCRSPRAEAELAWMQQIIAAGRTAEAAQAQKTP